MSLEKQFRFVTDRLKIKDVPIGKALLLMILAGIPGKLTTKLIRYITADVMTKEKGIVTYSKASERLADILGPLAGFGEAYLFKNVGAIKRFLGETGAEALALGTLLGSFDAGIHTPLGTSDIDISDQISDKTRDAILGLVWKMRGIGMPVATGALPERATSAWRTPAEEEYAGPPETPKAPEPTVLGTPEEIDPVQKVEERLEEMSKV